MSEHSALHLICSSNQDSRALDQCLQFCQPGDALLFMQSGVASMPWVQQASFESAGLSIHWLEADVLARGLAPLAELKSWQIVDDPGFVELVEQHNPIHTWT